MCRRFLLLAVAGLLVSAIGPVLAEDSPPPDDPILVGLSAATGSTATEMPAVPKIVEQFNSIDGKGGYPFTFGYWNPHLGSFVGDDPELMTHYQGVNRVQAPDGTAYLYLTRSGNPKPLGADYPGEILIVEMGDRNGTGDPFSFDALPSYQPLPDDHTVKSIQLNGSDLGPTVNWKHPGSGQQVGDYLFLPMEARCRLPLGSDGRCGDTLEGGAILVLQVLDSENPDNPVATPAEPLMKCQIEHDYHDDIARMDDLDPIGGLAATFDEESGKYLFAWKDGTDGLWFYEVSEGELCQESGGGEPPFVHYVGRWDADKLESADRGVDSHYWKRLNVSGVDQFFSWQMLNFVRDTDGVLYLLVTDKSRLGGTAGAYMQDWARLFRFTRQDVPYEPFKVWFEAEKHLYLNEGSEQIGSLAAVGGVYVTPRGRLVLYSGEHDNKWPNAYGCEGDERCRGLGMGEFAAAPLPTPDTYSMVGLVDPSKGLWHLGSDTGPAAPFYYGNPGDIPFMGDWDGDGIDTPGLFRQSDAFAYLRNSNTQGIADIRFYFGNPSDVPLAGDFNGDGRDTLSIYRPSEARFYIINKLGENEGGLGAAEYSFLFGNPGDKPVVGDWDGDGIDEIGLHRETTGFFYYRNTLTTGIADGQFFFGDPGDRFVAGDWGIVDGVETPAMFRPSNSTFYFRHTLTQGIADSEFVWTGAGMNWLPVSGDFTLD